MTHDAFERTPQRRSVELYHLWISDPDDPEGAALEDYYLTGADTDQVYGGQTYLNAAIGRGKGSYSEKLEANTLSVYIEPRLDPVDQYRVRIPLVLVWIQVFKMFPDQDPLETSPIFTGVVTGMNLAGPNVVLNCASLEYLLKKTACRWRIQPTCNHDIFQSDSNGFGCDPSGALLAAHPGVVGTITAISGNNITAAEFATKADGYFTRGKVKRGSDRVMITDHSGDTITLRQPLFGLAEGQSVTAFAGCDKRAETCKAFNNYPQFLGFLWVPQENPATRALSGIN